LQLGDNENDNAYSMLPNVWQPEYTISRYLSLPIAPDNNYYEPLQLTNGSDKPAATAAALPIANSEAESEIEQFMPQTNIIADSADGTVPRISDMEQYNNDRQARSKQKKT
jgi:hypothetical protein